jgi:hypothetical protein
MPPTQIKNLKKITLAIKEANMIPKKGERRNAAEASLIWNLSDFCAAAKYL